MSLHSPKLYNYQANLPNYKANQDNSWVHRDMKESPAGYYEIFTANKLKICNLKQSLIFAS